MAVRLQYIILRVKIKPINKCRHKMAFYLSFDIIWTLRSTQCPNYVERNETPVERKNQQILSTPASIYQKFSQKPNANNIAIPSTIKKLNNWVIRLMPSAYSRNFCNMQPGGSSESFLNWLLWDTRSAYDKLYEICLFKLFFYDEVDIRTIFGLFYQKMWNTLKRYYQNLWFPHSRESFA